MTVARILDSGCPTFRWFCEMWDLAESPNVSRVDQILSRSMARVRPAGHSHFSQTQREVGHPIQINSHNLAAYDSASARHLLPQPYRD